MKSLHSWSHPLLSLHVIYLSSITMMSPRHVNHMPFSGVWSLKLVWQSSVTINPKVETGKGRKKRIGWPGETRKQMGQWDWKWKETWVGLKMGLGPNRQADKGPDFSRAVSFTMLPQLKRLFTPCESVEQSNISHTQTKQQFEVIWWILQGKVAYRWIFKGAICERYVRF